MRISVTRMRTIKPLKAKREPWRGINVNRVRSITCDAADMVCLPCAGGGKPRKMQARGEKCGGFGGIRLVNKRKCHVDECGTPERCWCKITFNVGCFCFCTNIQQNQPFPFMRRSNLMEFSLTGAMKKHSSKSGDTIEVILRTYPPHGQTSQSAHQRTLYGCSYIDHASALYLRVHKYA